MPSARDLSDGWVLTRVLVFSWDSSWGLPGGKISRVSWRRWHWD